MYSSTCFGRPHAHHQKLNDCSSSLWFYLRIVVTAVLCSWSGYPHDTKVKPEAATAVTELLIMGGRTPKTCWAVHKRQENKLENCCIWLVIIWTVRWCTDLQTLKINNHTDLVYWYFTLHYNMSRLTRSAIIRPFFSVVKRRLSLYTRFVYPAPTW
jgi:hypothetical protein